MRILDVSPRAAYPPTVGSIVRTYNLLRHLGRNHDVHQFAQQRWRGIGRHARLQERRLEPGYHAYQYAHPVASAVTEVSERAWISAPVLSGVALSVCRPGLLTRLISSADIVLVEFPWQFEYCRRMAPAVPLVLAGHNVEALKFRDYARAMGVAIEGNRWLRFVESMERRAVRNADLVLAVSEADRHVLAGRYGAEPSRILTVPNGVDTNLFVPTQPQAKQDLKRRLGLPDKPTVIFVGANVPPNRVGLRWIRRLAGHAPDWTFLAVGSVAPHPSRHGNVIATGPVEDHRPYLGAADLAVCPIQYGGGTKIKLLEYLAAGLPAVAFAESLHGTELIPDEHLLVADRDERSIAGTLRRLADDRAFAERLGAQARRFVQERHDWTRIAETLDSALCRLAGLAPARPRSEASAGLSSTGTGARFQNGQG